MPEVLGEPPSPRTALFWNGAAWQWALVDAAGNLQIDVVDAAGLQDALQSVATDRLIVRGEDQLYSIAGTLEGNTTGAISGVDGYIGSPAVAAGQRWKLTSVAAANATTPTTRMLFYRRTGGVEYLFHDEIRAFAIGDWATWSGELWLAPTDVIRAYFIGGLVADVCVIDVLGHTLTIEV